MGERSTISGIRRVSCAAAEYGQRAPVGVARGLGRGGDRPDRPARSAQKFRFGAVLKARHIDERHGRTAGLLKPIFHHARGGRQQPYADRLSCASALTREDFPR